MPIQRHEVDFETLPADVLERWRGVPPAIVSDCMNRSNVMAAAIKPVAAGMRVIGQARTVTCMVGDNSAVHTAIGMMEPGEVLVVDAGGYEDTAVWGGIMTRAALQRGLAGLVVDGAVRDVAEIRELGFACFARATVPARPHKGFCGIIDGPISCAGCPVKPGYLVIGDDDGVAVVPLAWADDMLAASRDKIAQEEETLKAIAEGRSTADILGIGEPEMIGG